ncbi:hypothetical protein RN001_004230 [Aquatica leii]|uniref:Retrotransposon gag domain-containing protein n=1 Tax=Aquatica leii TaxID=1421715 RepID=A0AAN7PI31_9COLE|nr:hypothetical protein RN001_004230 [Aquatica leii]
MSRKRARDATPSDEGNDISTSARQSSEQSDAFTRLTEVMSDILKNSGSRRESTTVRSDVIPIFDRKDRNQEITAWCQKVDELKLIFGWSKEVTINFALGRLSGLAEVWYKGLTSVKLTWEEWKNKLQETFPYKKDFWELLNEMQRRRKRPHETYTKYYYEKCVLLNSCKIQRTDAVSCLIGGIDDNVVKTGTRAFFLRAYIDPGSSCATIRFSNVKCLRISYNRQDNCVLQGYSNGFTTALESVQLTLKVDEVEEVPILIGRNFTELPKVLMIKDDKILKFVKSDTKLIQDIKVEPPIRKVVLRVRKETTVPHDHLANVQVYKDYKGDLFVEARLCLQKGKEYVLPNTVLRVSTDGIIAIPCINLSDGNLNFHKDTIFARAWQCVKQRNGSIPKECMFSIKDSTFSPLPEYEIKIGPVNNDDKKNY